MRNRITVIRLFFMAAFVSSGLWLASSAQASLQADINSTARPPTEAQRQQLGGLSLPFIENRGQLDQAVAFYAHTFAGTAYVTRTGALVFSFPGKQQGEKQMERGPGWVLSETPVSNSRLVPQGRTVVPARIAVFHGNDPKTWRRDIKSYAGVYLGRPWPGIDYTLQAHGNSVERIFTVAPGADVSAIRMQVAGVEQLSLKQGALVAQTGNGPVTLSKPVAWQPIEGELRPVEVAYTLDGHHYGFRLGGYDAAYPLVIDPLVQATYLGGSLWDEATALLSGGGKVYVAGGSGSGDFPDATTGADPNNDVDGDLFIARLSADLATLEAATYLGGTGLEDPWNGTGLAIGSGGQIYVVSSTASTDFPGTTGGAQAASGGGWDTFVAELSSDLGTLLQATYLGGSGLDIGMSMAVGSNGLVYVAGRTGSANFPVTAGAADTALGGTYDGFVAVLNGGLTGLLQATYLGGSSNDLVQALTVDAGGVYAAGETSSSTGMPGLTGAAQPALGGLPLPDAFVSKLSLDLTSVVRSTYMGGSGIEYAFALTLDGSGALYVAGRTNSTDFPCTTASGPQPAGGGSCAGTADGAQPAYNGNTDAFVARLSDDLTALHQATYLGGGREEFGEALAVAGNSTVYLTGHTLSADLPGTVGGAQVSAADAGGATGDIYLARFDSTLTTLQQATYLGGSGDERVYNRGLALDASGNIYLAGSTTSAADFPAIAGGAQPGYAGGTRDAFVAKFDCLTSAACSVPPPSTTSSGGGGGALTLWSLLLLCFSPAIRRRCLV